MDTKSWYKSKTLWGGALIVVAFLLRAFGREETAGLIEAESTNIQAWLETLFAAIGSALVFYGRIKATTKLTG